MTQTLAKISLWVIYIGTAICLAVPLFVDNGFFFPFITTKILMFRIAVQIMLLAYLILNMVSGEYRPRFSKLGLLLGLFILIAAISSALGGNFYSSFWGDIERAEGLILWLHLFVLFVILGRIATGAS